MALGFNGGTVVATGVVKLRSDNTGLKSDLKDAESSVRRTAGTIGKLAGIGAAAVGAGLVKSAGAAIEAEKANARLESQLKALGISYRNHARQIDEVINKQSKLSALDDEDLTESFTNLVRTTRDVNEALRLNGIAADIARAKGISLEAASKLLQKAYMGSEGAAKRLGVGVRGLTKDMSAQEKGQRIVAELQKTFAGQAESYGKSAAGAQDRMRVAVENLQEAIGGRLVPVIAAVASTVARWIEKLTEIPGLATGVIGAFAGLGALSVAMRAVASATRTWAAAQRVLNLVMRANPFVLIATLIIALGAALVAAHRKSETFRNIVNAAFRAVRRVVQTVAEFITEKVPAAFGRVIDWVREHWPEIVTLISGPFAPLAGLATNAFGIRDKFIGALRAIKDFARDRVSDIVGFFTGIPSRLAGLASTIGTTLAKAFKAGVNAIISVWNRVKIPSFHIHIGMPSPIPDIDFSTPEINFPDVPYLRRGGALARLWPGARAGQDSILALLAPGEMVLTPAHQEQLGGRGFLMRLLGLREVRAGAGVPGFAAGGVIALASSQVGNREEPDGSNQGPQINKYFDETGGARGNPWCATFATWVFKKSGLPYPRSNPHLVANWYSWANSDETKAWSGDKPRVGALFLKNQQTSSTEDDHIGIVARVYDDGSFDTVEGNHGNRVATVRRSKSSVYKFVYVPGAVDGGGSGGSGGSGGGQPAEPGSPTVPDEKWEKAVANGRAFRWARHYWGPGVPKGKLADFKAWLRSHGGSWKKFKVRHKWYADLLESGTTVPERYRQAPYGQGAPEPGETTIPPDELADPTEPPEDVDVDVGAGPGVTDDMGGGGAGGGGGSGGLSEEDVQARIAAEAAAIWAARARFFTEFAPNIFTLTPAGLTLGSSPLGAAGGGPPPAAPPAAAAEQAASAAAAQPAGALGAWTKAAARAARVIAAGSGATASMPLTDGGPYPSFQPPFMHAPPPFATSPPPHRFASGGPHVTVIQNFQRPPDDQFAMLRRAHYAARAAVR